MKGRAIPELSGHPSIGEILSGDSRAVARALSRVEDSPDSQTTELLRELYGQAGKAFVIGVTGSPGAGKSTLVDQLAALYSRQGERVGIVAVDPSSPFSGGAILGDRIRMQSLTTDPNIFIRSMATRGKMGGLSGAVNDALVVLDAAGYQTLIVETVGVGQDEVDIVRTADVTVVILVPGMGDDVQTMKAGIMEIGDLFVINKSDHPEILRTERELEALLSISRRDDGWQPPVVKTVATRGEGIEDLAEALQRFRSFLQTDAGARRRGIPLYRLRIQEMLKERLVREIEVRVPEQELEELARQLMERQTDPYTIVEDLLGRIAARGEGEQEE